MASNHGKPNYVYVIFPATVSSSNLDPSCIGSRRMKTSLVENRTKTTVSDTRFYLPAPLGSGFVLSSVAFWTSDGHRCGHIYVSCACVVTYVGRVHIVRTFKMPCRMVQGTCVTSTLAVELTAVPSFATSLVSFIKLLYRTLRRPTRNNMNNRLQTLLHPVPLH